MRPGLDIQELPKLKQASQLQSDYFLVMATHR